MLGDISFLKCLHVVHNYTKIKDLHSRIITSLPNLYALFHSSPKINRILITRSFPYNESRHDSYPQFPRSSLGTRGLKTRSNKKKKRLHFKSLTLLKHARLINGHCPKFVIRSDAKILQLVVFQKITGCYPKFVTRKRKIKKQNNILMSLNKSCFETICP